MGTIQIDGSTPKLTIGNATAEDATILFDGNAQDFYIALDDSADDLLIGLGSTVGTTPAIAIDENLKVNIPVTTASTSASTGSLTTGGGAGIGADLYVGDDVYLITDSAVLGFGADKDTTLTHTDGTGLTLNSTNKLCFNDASQYIQGASNAILDIAATDEIELTSTLVDLNGNLDVSGTTLLPTLGVITAKDLGVGIHIKTADSGASVSANSDELVIENSGHAGITIASGNSSEGTIKFADDGNAAAGYIHYAHGLPGYYIGVEAADVLTIKAGPKIGIGVAPSDVGLKLQTTEDSQYVVQLRHGDADNPQGLFIDYYGGDPDNTSDYFMYCQGSAGTARMTVASDGDVKNHDNSYGATSDQRIKDNIADASSQWDDIKALKVRKFQMKDDIRSYGADAKYKIGLVAQEAESVSPNLIALDNPTVSDVASDSSFGTLVDDIDNLDKDGNPTKKVGEVKEKVKRMKYSILYMKAIKALQEAQTRIETLETKVTALEG